MDNQTSLSPENLKKLLQLAASRLGTSPEQLASSLQSGKLDQVIQDPAASRQMKEMMADPEKMKQALGQNPSLAQFLKQHGK